MKFKYDLFYKKVMYEANFFKKRNGIKVGNIHKYIWIFSCFIKPQELKNT